MQLAAQTRETKQQLNRSFMQLLMSSAAPEARLTWHNMRRLHFHFGCHAARKLCTQFGKAAARVQIL
jgi:hypothetical protein